MIYFFNSSSIKKAMCSYFRGIDIPFFLKTRNFSILPDGKKLILREPENSKFPEDTQIAKWANYLSPPDSKYPFEVQQRHKPGKTSHFRNKVQIYT